MYQVGQGRVMVDVNSMTKKEDMLAGVFRDFNPATMTVEEWGEIEYERMKEQSRLNAQKEMEKAEAEAALTEVHARCKLGRARTHTRTHAHTHTHAHTRTHTRLEGRHPRHFCRRGAAGRRGVGGEGGRG